MLFNRVNGKCKFYIDESGWKDNDIKYWTKKMYRTPLIFLAGGFAKNFPGRRVRKVDSKASETTLYYYNENWQVLAEYDGSGVFQKMNVYGNYIDELIYRRGTGVFTRRFYVHDHLYSPVASIRAFATVSERYEYDAYGHCTIWDSTFTTQRTKPADTPNYPNPYLFTGRRIDYLDSGDLPLMYYRNRSYDTYTGRFLQHDPIGYAESLNLYTYVKNNPAINLDPQGLAPWYGNYCGPGNVGGKPHDDLDSACQDHDNCYTRCGGPGGVGGLICPSPCRRGCDAKLCVSAMLTDCFRSKTPWKCHAARLIIAEIFCARSIISPV